MGEEAIVVASPIAPMTFTLSGDQIGVVGCLLVAAILVLAVVATSDLAKLIRGK